MSRRRGRCIVLGALVALGVPIGVPIGGQSPPVSDYAAVVQAYAEGHDAPWAVAPLQGA